jgi:murein L,D-transpeptidase YafK
MQMKTRYPIFFTVLCLLILSAGTARAVQYDLEVSKSERVLKVKQGDKVIKVYHIAFGRGGKGNKHEMGDNKTPVGSYRIINFKPDSKFYYFMQLNYPNLTDAWHGYKDRLITAREFKLIASAYRYGDVPPQDTMLGGYIGIHGLGKVSQEQLDIHSRFNWTEGCIAMKNEEIRDLRRFVSIGTRVFISD